MFIKKLLVGERPADSSFWRNYEAEVQAFSTDAKGERRKDTHGSVFFHGPMAELQFLF